MSEEPDKKNENKEGEGALPVPQSSSPPANTGVAPLVSATPVSHPHHPWRWPVTLMVLAMLAFAGYWITIKETTSIFKGGAKKASEVGDMLSGAADTFNTQQISQSFLSQLPTKIEQGGDQLEVANYEAVESFRSESQRKLAWDKIDLGTTVSEVRVPVTYRYHVLLSDKWNLEVHDNICFVTAPRIRPTQPPAIHTHRMEKFASRGWLRFDSMESMEQLQRTITPTVISYAADDKHIALIKDSARKGIAGFVKNWLLDQDYWNTNSITRIIVSFDGEETSDFQPGQLIENPPE